MPTPLLTALPMVEKTSTGYMWCKNRGSLWLLPTRLQPLLLLRLLQVGGSSSNGRLGLPAAFTTPTLSAAVEDEAQLPRTFIQRELFFFIFRFLFILLNKRVKIIYTETKYKVAL